MWSWLANNAALVQVTLSGVTAFVWIVYLQIIVSSLRHQRRTEILIHLVGSRGLNARTFISNLGLEPVYLLEIMLTIWSSDGKRETSVVNRTERGKDEVSSPSAATFQGPLKSSDFVDIGSIENLIERARLNTAADLEPGEITQIEVTVAANSAATSTIVAAQRTFNVTLIDGDYCLCPLTLYAKQLRSWWARYRVRQRLLYHLGQ
ncbi:MULTISPECIES: hypothetical protein [Roseobacteraceae]|uniref:Uncharacterized protein n=1 Tax=Pseudosulfitobacter pseudonitzschiae TaxID=1402135 RepID=A0A221K670_9RHOB|nr:MULTISPECIES: hypothetical protein [Roseobacteraceae]ASM74501.1 hypothetical protein SULPSESMR1_04805 [Pseudosulfitobacter pseudonitzschiae]